MPRSGTGSKQKEREEALTQLREWIKPGDTVYTILDHVSSSGMSRAIRVLVPLVAGPAVESVAPGGKPTDYIRRDGVHVDFIHPNHAVGVVLGLRHWKHKGRIQDALVVSGCGMDMGFHLVYELSHALYGSGYQCLGKGRCPSNYHVNHKDTIQCAGTEVYKPDGPNTGQRCRWSREAGAWVIGEGDDVCPYDKVCPVCKGKGRVPNPDGPERFDLVHTDGYAVRHRWL